MLAKLRGFGSLENTQIRRQDTSRGACAANMSGALAGQYVQLRQRDFFHHVRYARR